MRSLDQIRAPCTHFCSRTETHAARTRAVSCAGMNHSDSVGRGGALLSRPLFPLFLRVPSLALHPGGITWAAALRGLVEWHDCNGGNEEDEDNDVDAEFSVFAQVFLPRR